MVWKGASQSRARMRIDDVYDLGPSLLFFLFFQSTHALDIEGLEFLGVVGLVRRKVFLVWFQANTTLLADFHHHNSPRLALSDSIFLFREGDAYFRNWAIRRAGRVLHQIALFIVNIH